MQGHERCSVCMCVCMCVCIYVCEWTNTAISGMASCDEGVPNRYYCIKTFDCGSLWYYFVRACTQRVEENRRVSVI